MKKFILTIALLALTTTTALAGGYGRGYQGGYNNYRGGYNGWNYGAAALGGAIIGGALVYGATRPYYYAPAPVYTVPPPVYYAPAPVYTTPPPNTYVDPNPAPVLYWDSVCQCYR